MGWGQNNNSLFVQCQHVVQEKFNLEESNLTTLQLM